MTNAPYSYLAIKRSDSLIVWCKDTKKSANDLFYKKKIVYLQYYLYINSYTK